MMDYLIKLDLKDSTGKSFKSTDVKDLKIQVFTNSIKDNVIITNFIERDGSDYMVLNAQDLSTIESGVISYLYSWYTDDDNFTDKKYNQSEVVYTNHYWQNPYQRIDKYDQLQGQFKFLLETVCSLLSNQNQIVLNQKQMALNQKQIVQALWPTGKSTNQ